MQRRDPVAVLPSELTSACFVWLNLKNRIAVSHVSRSWRAAALSDLSLWNAYSVQSNRPVALYKGLPAMLLRSDPAPFHLTCFGDVPDTLVELLAEHMRRIQALYLYRARQTAVLTLMAQDAPVLEYFGYSSSTEPNNSLTLTWSDTRAPRLRGVVLGNSTLTGNGVFSSMDTFCCRMPYAGSLARPLASIFPALTSIQLLRITQSTLDSLLPLPPRLTSVILSSSWDTPIDYTAFLKGCAAIKLSHMSIRGGSAASLAAAVNLFARVSHGAWEVILRGNDDLTLYAEPAVKHSVSCDSPAIAPQPCLAGVLSRVSSLSLSPGKYYEELYRWAGWDRAMPALTRLELVVHGTKFPILDVPGRPIDAPALAEISIRIRYVSRDAALVLPFVTPFVRSLVCPQLAHIALFAAHHGYLVGADLSCVAELAPRISIRSLDENGL